MEPLTLSAWTALEVLSPQTFTDPNDLASAAGAVASFDDELLPWNREDEPSLPDHRLYYQVVIGTISYKKAIKALVDRYADERPDRPPAKGEAIQPYDLADIQAALESAEEAIKHSEAKLRRIQEEVELDRRLRHYKTEHKQQQAQVQRCESQYADASVIYERAGPSAWIDVQGDGRGRRLTC